MKEKKYECIDCKKIKKTTDNETPNCCGKPMRQLPLDVCTQPAHAEHSRPMEHEDSCNEGRSG